METQKSGLGDVYKREFQNSDTGMTRERYLELCEQMGNEPIDDEIPPDFDDLPDIMVYAVNTFNMMGDKVYADIGYTGKDYTNVSHYIELYGIEDKEYFFQLLSWLDSRAIKKSSEDMKRQYEKAKRQSKSGQQNKINYTG